MIYIKKYILLFLTILTIVSCGCSSFMSDFDAGYALSQNSFENEDGIVKRVIDGDTIEVTFDNGITDKVRLVGIDTPETYSKSDTKDWFGLTDAQLKPFGHLATNYTTETLLGQRVTIQYDIVAGKTDTFKRRLGYVFLDGENVNVLLVEKGLARTYIEGNSELKYFLMQQQTYAMKSCLGVWSLQCQN